MSLKVFLNKSHTKSDETIYLGVGIIHFKRVS